jgi:two-component system chemotaxis response regulator CheB
MIKLLIVEDSALMRKHLRQIFQRQANFELQTARDGLEALQLLHEFQPDVISLDINMPGMDGLTVLSRIMIERPTPVVMVSSLTEKGALATFEALELGAVDFVTKPGGTISIHIEQIEQELVAKMRNAATAKVRQSRGLAQRIRFQNIQKTAPKAEKKPVFSGVGVVLIGVSTGGPRTLEDILPLLPADFPWPVVISQHMPPNFTNALAKRMDTMCALSVMEVAQPTLVESGCIYIGRGGADLIFSQRAKGITLLARPENNAYLWHPSVELMVKSALDHYPPEMTIGVMLTGMGFDGAEAMTELHRRGGRTIAESEQSAVVFGMPAELIKRGGAELILDSEKIAHQLNYWLK